MLNLTEHVISQDMAKDMAYLQSLPHPRQTEILRRLGYPIWLITATHNVIAALESNHILSTTMSPDALESIDALTTMLSEHFDELGEYTQTYPLAISRIVWYQRRDFKKYLRSMLPIVDMRYIDFVYDLPIDIYRAYTAHPFPASSLNLHIQTSTIPVMAAILIRLKNDPRKHLLHTRHDNGKMHVVYRRDSACEIYAHYILFDHLINSVGDDMINDDDLRVLALATFNTTEGIKKCFLYHTNRRLYNRILGL